MNYKGEDWGPFSNQFKEEINENNNTNIALQN